MATFKRTQLNQLRYDTVITLLDKYATRIEHNKYEFYNTLETDEIFEEYNEIIVLIYHNKVITNIQKGKYKISNSLKHIIRFMKDDFILDKRMNFDDRRLVNIVSFVR